MVNATSTVLSGVQRAVEHTLATSGQRPLAFRFAVLIDGLDASGEPFNTVLTSGDLDTAVELVELFGDLRVAGAS